MVRSFDGKVGIVRHTLEAALYEQDAVGPCRDSLFGTRIVLVRLKVELVRGAKVEWWFCIVWSAVGVTSEESVRGVEGKPHVAGTGLTYL